MAYANQEILFVKAIKTEVGLKIEAFFSFQPFI